MDTPTLLTLRIPSFEAAIRKATDPQLTSRPVIIVTSLKPQGRVLSLCPNAQSTGITEETHYPTARAACPEAAFFTPDKQLAQQAMQAILHHALAYSPQVETAGTGCVVLDTQGTEKLWGGGFQAATKALRNIRKELRLPLAAGLATRHPWSLLASRAANDDDIREVTPGSENDFLDNVPIAWIDGVNAGTRTKLMEMNIRMAGQLRQFNREHLLRHFGASCGETLWNVLHPRTWRIGAAGPAEIESANDMIRAGAHLSEASVEKEKIRLAARTLAGQIAASLRKRGLGAARLELTLMHTDGVMKSALSQTGGFVQDETLLIDVAERLLERVFQRRVRVARFWLTAEKLAAPERQGVLFPVEPRAASGQPPAPVNRKMGELLHTLDNIRSRFGDGTVRPAALLPRIVS